MTVRFGQTGTKLTGYGAGLLFRNRRTLDPLRQRFPYDKLHADEVNLALSRRSRVNFENLAHVRMADLTGIPDLRWKLLAKA
jgi:hypothetical protein